MAHKDLLLRVSREVPNSLPPIVIPPWPLLLGRDFLFVPETVDFIDLPAVALRGTAFCRFVFRS